MRKLIRGSLLLVLFSLLIINSFGATSTKILVNASPIQLNNQLIIKDGSVYISLRDIGEALGYEFSWSKELQTANLKNNKQIIALKPNNRWYTKMQADGTKGNFMFNKGQGPIMIGGRIYVKLIDFTIVAGGMINKEVGTNTYHIFCNTELDYANGVQGQKYAGNGTKGNQDGSLTEARFSYAQSICRTKDKTIYIADAGVVRKISKGMVESLKTSPSNVKIVGVRSNGNDVYAVSKVYQNEAKERVCSIFKLEGETLKEIYTKPVNKEKIIDFTVVSDKQMAVLRQVNEENSKYLDMVSLDKPEEIKPEKVDNGFTCLASDGKKVFLGNPEKGTISAYDVAKKTLTLFSGVEGEHRFQDGAEARYCAPRKLKCANGKLYILDYSVIRKITINDTKAGMCQTVAGKVTADNKLTVSTGYGKNMILSPINPIDFDVNEESILLTDANKCMIVEIK